MAAKVQKGWLPADPKLPNELSQKLLVALRKSQKSQVRAPPVAVPVGRSVSSVPRTQVKSQPGIGVGKRAFAVGEEAYYWSTSHRNWLRTRVISLNKDAAGITRTYNLNCKSKVEAWQMRRVDEALEGPPDVSESGGGGGFAVGMPVQCFNHDAKMWEDGVVGRRYQHNKITVFDVDCNGHVIRMLPASRLRLNRLAVGDDVEYWSSSSKSWVPAKVMKLYWSKRLCDLDVKRNASLANVRKPLGVPESGAKPEPAKPREGGTAAPQAQVPESEAWSMVVAPAVLLTLGVAAQLSSNGVLFSEALAISDTRWLPTTALSAWSYHWCLVRAVCHGITDAFHGVFVEVPQRLFTRPNLTWQHFWNFSTNGTDFLNLFAADVPQYNELVEGDFHGNFHTFRATVMLMRLLLTVLFACLRLIAVIARTPDRDDSDESDESWLEEEEDIICP